MIPMVPVVYRVAVLLFDWLYISQHGISAISCKIFVYDSMGQMF